MGEPTFRILTINPGSTSTKTAVFENETLLCEETIRYDHAELAGIGGYLDQEQRRTQDVTALLSRHGQAPEDFDAIVGRGGLTKPIPSGTYVVNDRMLADLKSGAYSVHACNLGALIAHNLGAPHGVPSYVVDPVVVDELAPEARITGCPGIEVRCSWHALNQKAIARRYAKQHGTTYEALNLVVAHMGGGVTVGAHRHGLTVDVNNAIDGDGPMTPERTGCVPYLPLVHRLANGECTLEDIEKLPSSSGGVKAYLGTSDMREVEARVLAGDEEAALVFDAMAYQIAKAIGAQVAVLEGDVDAILLTGGLAYSELFVKAVVRRVCRLAPVEVFPGEDELTALAEGALRVLRGEEQARVYA